MKKQDKAKLPALLALITAMTVFGTIGVVKRNLPLGAGTVAFFRAGIGVLFLSFGLFFRRVRGKPSLLLPYLWRLVLSGACIGANWILLFEAFEYTTVAVATVSYYMAPLFMLVAAFFLFGERLTGARLACLLVAVFGMAAISGLVTPGGLAGGNGKGVLLALGAAFLYASVILQNRALACVPAYLRTLVQLGSAALVLFPYVCLVEAPLDAFSLPTPSLLLLVTLGVLHTGVAYVLYFFSVGRLAPVSVALFSYLDPVIAVLLSALVLGEALSPLGIVGTVAVLGAAALGELLPSGKKK